MRHCSKFYREVCDSDAGVAGNRLPEFVSKTGALDSNAKRWRSRPSIARTDWPRSGSAGAQIQMTMVESRRLRAGPKDPADRFLAATARVYELTLVTADRRLAAAPGVLVIRNK